MTDAPDDILSAVLERLGELETQTAGLRAQVGELRREISELEATSADLADEVRRLAENRLPWPLSLLEGPAEFVGSQLTRLEALFTDAAQSGGSTAPRKTDLP